MKRPIFVKHWLLAFAGIVLLLVLSIMCFNYWTDPFGAFGDHFFQWWSYDETMNPSVAKLSYLEQNHEKYDSYIVGTSNAGSYPTEQLNKYYGANFYNLVMYEADMKDVEMTCQYLIDNYTVKNLVVSLNIYDAEVYDTKQNARTNHLHYKVDGSSPLLFYGKYLFSDPRIGLEKLKRSHSDPYLQQSYRVFHAETGAYDRSRQDLEPIGDLESYVAGESHSAFTNSLTVEKGKSDLGSCMESVGRIKEKCAAAGIRLTVICPPLYYEHLARYSAEEQAAFFNALAQVTDYWDFSLTSASYDPRYFYDSTQFRNCVGKMLLARMFDDSSVYYPDDMGRYILQGNSPGAPQVQKPREEDYTASVPILMYHHLAQTGEGQDIISVRRFEEHMAALCDAGYQTVTFEDLRAYVEQGTSLPEKPVLITFDDGYESNYTLAYPVLQKYGMRATIFVIGVSLGKETYKDTGHAMTPHFSLEQAQEMMASGLISIQSHGYDMHNVSGLDQAPLRSGVLQMEGESEADYIHFLRQDSSQMQQLLGYTPGILAYPYGSVSELSEMILSEMGIWATVTIVPKCNTIIRGMPQTLRQLGRFYMKEAISADELLLQMAG